MLKTLYTSKYWYFQKELLAEKPELNELIKTRIHLFQNNPEDTRLDNHALKKQMLGQWAFSITGDIRLVYRWTGKNTVQFLAIGGHKKVYSVN